MDTGGGEGVIEVMDTATLLASSVTVDDVGPKEGMVDAAALLASSVTMEDGMDAVVEDGGGGLDSGLDVMAEVISVTVMDERHDDNEVIQPSSPGSDNGDSTTNNIEVMDAGGGEFELDVIDAERTAIVGGIGGTGGEEGTVGSSSAPIIHSSDWSGTSPTLSPLTQDTTATP